MSSLGPSPLRAWQGGGCNGRCGAVSQGEVQRGRYLRQDKSEGAPLDTKPPAGVEAMVRLP